MRHSICIVLLSGAMALAAPLSARAETPAPAPRAKPIHAATAPAKPRPLSFCATEKTKSAPACVGADDPVTQRALSGETTQKNNRDGKLGVNWGTSSDRYRGPNDTVSNLDAINRTLPGAPVAVEGTHVGVGTQYRVCILCE